MGLALSVVLWGVAEYSENRRTLVSLSAAAAGGAVLAYLIGVWATASSGARGVMPAFP